MNPSGQQREAAVEITVDGAAVTARSGELLIAACERNGVHIPRFCYHPRMSPVGMCRMCLVEVDSGRGFALQPSCMVTVVDQMKVSTNSEAAKKAQDGVLEFLLINHPLDCPVCDKGGECPLQDQTMAYGPGETRFVEEKRHFPKPIPISETVFLDRERCILCDRCTRFADEVAGDALIHFMGRGNHTEVNTFTDEPFVSYFSGNTVQICPVGALTAAPYRFKARPWDLSECLSTAWVDSVGSRVALQASRNRMLRVLGADADAVNWGWLSDKERFGFEALNSEERLSSPRLRHSAGDAGHRWCDIGWGEALNTVAAALEQAPPERVAVLGGARLTNESQYMWAKLAKGVIGTDNIDAQLGDGLDPAVVLGLPRATIDEACRPGGVVVLLGPDPKEELGVLYLRLRHAVVNDGVTLIEVTPSSTGLSHLARHCLRPAPGRTAQLVEALAAAACHGASEGDPSGSVAESASESFSGPAAEEVREAARCLNEALADGAGVTVILGRASPAEASSVVEAAARSLAAKVSARFLPALRRGNVLGALESGLSPGLLPGRVGLAEAPEELSGLWPRLPDEPGLDAAGTLRAAADGGIDVLLLVGADPLNDFVDRDLAYRGLKGAGSVVSVDLFVNDSAELAAAMVLPAAGPSECDGTFTNIEGRVSLMSRKVTPPGTARPDWMIAADLAERLEPGSASGLDSPEAVRAELASASDVHKPLTEQALGENRLEGVLLASAEPSPMPTATLEATLEASAASDTDTAATPVVGRIPEGAYALVAARTMYDDGVMLRHCPSSRKLAEPARARVNPDDLAREGLSDGAAVRVVSDCGHVEATLAGDSGVPPGSLKLDWLSPGAPANTLIAAGSLVTAVRIQTR
ncbi:MAG: NADH-quinone oxidoreductase subunit NuoG [Acidimicrobiaceae bacterium]|nr:NADH-quinone oxidoreductase subunit NuoG [Acidimicrobiaceae bacterium]